MKTREAAHRRFVEFCSAFYRHCNWEDPIFTSDEDTPVAFKADVDDVTFSIGYDPLGGDYCLFAYCVFGVVPPNAEAQPLRRLLERNASAAREHGTFCIDAGTQELAYYMRRTTDVDIDALKADMAAIAAQAHRWRRHGDLGDEAQDASADGEATSLPVWTQLA